MSGSGLKTGAVGLAIAAAFHVSGALAGIEHSVSPGVARTSLNLFRLYPEGGWQAASKAVQEAAKGSDGERIAARAACAYLNVANSGTERQEGISQRIYAYVPIEYRAYPGVDAAVGSLATKLSGATEPGAAGQVYRRACFG
jgi:hypothetical protein